VFSSLGSASVSGASPTQGEEMPAARVAPKTRRGCGIGGVKFVSTQAAVAFPSASKPTAIQLVEKPNCGAEIGCWGW
jgi:hypothetical protein